LESKKPGHVADVAQALLGIPLEAGFEERLDWMRDRGPVGLFGQYSGERVGDGVGGEELTAREHLVHDDAEGPNVGAFVHDLATSVLRAHVGGGAKDHTGTRHGHTEGRRVFGLEGGGFGGMAFRQSEIEDFDGTVRGDFDVSGLEVAVDDAAFVGGLESLGDLAGDGEGFVKGERALPDVLGEGGAFDEFHDQVIGADVVDRADVRMVEGGDGAGFALESFVEFFFGNFDGDRAIEAGIAGSVDLSHAARAEDAFNEIGT
jgi:hypothetical protein